MDLFLSEAHLRERDESGKLPSLKGIRTHGACPGHPARQRVGAGGGQEDPVYRAKAIRSDLAGNFSSCRQASAVGAVSRPVSSRRAAKAAR